MKIKKRLLSFILIGCVLCGSLVPSYSVSAAPVVSTVAQLASYVLATTGFVNIATNGAVSSASGSVLDALKTKIADTIGSGIYVDSNGNYVFNETTTNEIYEILDSNNSEYDVRVISDFGASFAENALLFRDDPMVSPEMRQNINNYIDNYSDTMNWLIVLQIVPISNNTYWTLLSFIYMNDVKYLLCNDNNITFRDLNGDRKVRLFDIYSQTYNTDNNSFSGISHTTGETYSNLTFISDPSLVNFKNIYLANYFQLIDYAGNVSQEFIYNNFPFKYDGKTLIWSNRSLILGKNVEKVNSFLTSGSGNYVSNTYNVIPSISEDTLINNDWGGIYNSYVTNVRNNYNSDMDTTELVNLLKNNTDIISNAISSGVDDIESVIFTTNAWLKKISNLLTSINYKIDNIGSGGGGSGVTNDYTQALQRIENYAQGIKGDTSRMAQLEAYLSQLVSNSDSMVEYLRKIASGTGSPSIPDAWDVLLDMPDSDILDTISNLELIQLALKNVVPFCFISVIGEFFAVFAVSPQAPRFEIPVAFHNSFVDIDESIIIDLSFFDPIQPIIIVFWYAVFVVCLAYLTFKLFWFWTVFFYS